MTAPAGPVRRPDLDHDPVAHAKRYPFDVPDASYLFRAGRAEPLAAEPDLAGRIAVIASGSNASRLRLGQKFGGFAGDCEIPVTLARVAGFRVAYSAHFARYGSIPATLEPAPGGRAQVFVTWLTGAQAEHMHGTELIGENYGFYRLPDGCLQGPWPAAPPAHAYLSIAGTWHDGAGPLLPARVSQVEALSRARDIVAPGRPLDDLLAEIIHDDRARGRCREKLAAHGRPARHAGLRRLA